MRQGLLGLLVAVPLGLGTVVVGMAIADSRDPMPRAIVLAEPTDTPDPTAGLSRYRVVRVMDGDRLVVDAGGKELGVRLCGVDAPGLGERLGVEARAGLGRLVLGKVVWVRVVRMVGGEVVAEVLTEDESVGAVMVGVGLAVVDGAEGCPGRLGLELNVEMAERDRLGVWGL